jgi:ribulose-phosphate 3-epimerase
MLAEVLDLADYVLLMSVNPGFGGQKFIPRTLDRLRELRALRDRRGLKFDLEVDGGITSDNVGEVVMAGANWLVAGVTVFAAPDPAAAFRELQEKAERAACPAA